MNVAIGDHRTRISTSAHTADGYSQSITNLGRVSLSSDNVFGEDGGVHQLAVMTGDATGGFTIDLTIAV